MTDTIAGLPPQVLMTELPPYDCFDIFRQGHSNSVDTLFEKGVWIGFLAEGLRGARYRGLPSFRELEDNYKDLTLPFPTPLQNTPCSDRQAVCRGCVSNRSGVLQLHEIRFGCHGKVVILPLKGPDDALLFCIMLPQPQDRSIKALETFRPFEHDLQHDNDVSFSNSYMLLAIRDRNSIRGIFDVVRNTLDPIELTRIANRSGRQRSDPALSGQPNPKPTIEKNPGTGRILKLPKRKQQQQTADDGSGSRNLAKRSMPVTPEGRRRSAQVVPLSDDELAEPLLVPGERRMLPKPLSQQQAPIAASMLPGNAPQQAPMVAPTVAPIPTPIPSTTNLNTSQFTDEQSNRIHLVWEVDYEGMIYEIRRCFTATCSFASLLDSFREEAKLIPSAGRQMRASIWGAKYSLPDGTSKAVLVKPSSPHSEFSFEGLLRHLAEQELWKRDNSLIVEIKIRAMVSNSDSQALSEA